MKSLSLCSRFLIFLVSLLLMCVADLRAQFSGLEYRYEPGLKIDSWKDQRTGSMQSNAGVSVIRYYNAISNGFHGYADLNFFKGSLDPSISNKGIYATASVILGAGLLGQEPGWRPFVGGGAALGGKHTWSWVLAAQITKVGSSYGKIYPYVNFEYYTRFSAAGRYAFTIGISLPSRK